VENANAASGLKLKRDDCREENTIEISVAKKKQRCSTRTPNETTGKGKIHGNGQDVSIKDEMSTVNYRGKLQWKASLKNNRRSNRHGKGNGWFNRQASREAPTCPVRMPSGSMRAGVARRANAKQRRLACGIGPIAQWRVAKYR
jgi:hypothetical protein